MAIKKATKRIPNVYELFYDKNGDLLQSPDTISFKAQDNYANLLVINLEDGIEDDSILLINFTPKNAVINYTTHWFYVRPLMNVKEVIIEGENEPRVFTSYIYEVPRIVLNNFSKKTTIENEITIAKRYGIHSVGVFNTYIDLINEYPANEELYENNGFAYILNDDLGNLKGYYQVEQVSNGVYNWTLRENVMNFGLEQKQYEVKNSFTERGYENIDNVPTVEGTVVEALWRDLSVILNDTIDLSDRLDDVESNLTQLDGKVDNLGDYVIGVESNVIQLESGKQNKLIAGENIAIVDDVISAIGGSGGGYPPDEETIVLNNNNKLKVSNDLEIDGGYL